MSIDMSRLDNGHSLDRRTNTAETHPSKVDDGMQLSGNQRVWGPQDPVDVIEQLPYSPAAGAPAHDGEFEQGHRWSEVDGKIQAHSGQVEI